MHASRPRNIWKASDENPRPGCRTKKQQQIIYRDHPIQIGQSKELKKQCLVSCSSVARFPVIRHFFGSWGLEISMWRRPEKCCHCHWCGVRNIRLIRFSLNIKHLRSLRTTFQAVGTTVTKVKIKYSSVYRCKCRNTAWMSVTSHSTQLWLLV